jgi:hypothetical protein
MRIVKVQDSIQKDYTYTCTEPVGRNFHKDFKPDLTPSQMLELGVFGGHYMTDCTDEFPKSWFLKAKISKNGYDKDLNFFKVKASQSLSYWREKGWIYKDDPRGWFQWYARYYQGRRIPGEDERQINRFKSMKRHITQLVKNCRSKDLTCRRKQRQALLHWAYDSRNM